ncbi:MAG: response regulator [Cyclobacteriaceae bacterium]
MVALYIDDDLEDTEIFHEAISSVDPHIVFYSASDGHEGFKVLDQITVVPDFIFLDVNMPRMNGREFLSQIKKTVRLRSIPVIMYSTTCQKDEIRVYKNLGAKDFIIKPDNFEKLRQTLKEIIARQSMPGE